LPGEQEDRDEVFDFHRKELKNKIQDDDVCILEDADLSISETGTSFKTKLDFTEFKYNRKITDFEVCYIINLITYVILL
jgi:hypothetical protein